jgi:ACS family hexuronate transporter-like MFS transporter
MTITNDVYPMDCIGTVSGLLMLGSGIGGFLFQGIVARMAQNLSYGPVFAMMGFMHPLALLICVVVLRRADSNLRSAIRSVPSVHKIGAGTSTTPEKSSAASVL